MTPAAIIQQAAADGVALVLSEDGAIKAGGASAPVIRWTPIFRQQKSELLFELQLAELDRLISIVAPAYDTPADEHKLIHDTALRDLPAALQAFRAMAAELATNNRQRG